MVLKPSKVISALPTSIRALLIFGDIDYIIYILMSLVVTIGNWHAFLCIYRLPVNAYSHPFKMWANCFF